MKQTLDLNRMGLAPMDAIEMQETVGGLNILKVLKVIVAVIGVVVAALS